MRQSRGPRRARSAHLGLGLVAAAAVLAVTFGRGVRGRDLVRRSHLLTFGWAHWL
ncbi:hypothetical protein AB0D08_02310 [Kitasatospora sp. NPDC048540]|uniref:hypothetical protein n=1 Tax=Kitasatospora sp. NPDC048540 TaxID=3155634 RepID=UPI0033CE3A12